VYPAFRSAARLFSVKVIGGFSPTSVGRIVLEGGVIGHIQLADYMSNSTCKFYSYFPFYMTLNVNKLSAATWSSDGTTHKSINYVSKHLNMVLPDAPDVHQVLALPISTIDDHSSQSQLGDWIKAIKAIFAIYTQFLLISNSLSASGWRNFVCKLKGASTDHAADQKLLVQLFIQWKRIVDRELRGEAALQAKSPLELLETLYGYLSTKGLSPKETSWSLLPLDEQMRLASEAFRALCVPFGEAGYQELSIEEQAEVDFFVWAGCCMHKSLNATKAGFEGMTAVWPLIPGAVPPTKMLNKENAAAAISGPTSERDRVLALSKGGASKLTELLGALLKHKDDKKGQQDLYKIAYLVCDTSFYIHIHLILLIAHFWAKTLLSRCQQYTI
jgi:hypothetical protein